jgi:hypothetical protein
VPSGVVVVVPGDCPQAGIRSSDAPARHMASSTHAFGERRPLIAQPIPTKPSNGRGSQEAGKRLGGAAEPVMTGPNVLMVIVEVTDVPLPVTGFGLNEHTGGIVTSGVIELQDKVTPELGMTYPLIGFTLITPSAPLPAGTLDGATVLTTVMVKVGTEAKTVSVRGFAVWVPDASVPLIDTV